MVEVTPSVVVEEVTTTEGLEALRPEWAELWRRCPDATPFQSPEWLLPWWRHFAGVGLWVLTLRRGGRLVGLAPLFVYANPEAGERQVLLMGTGITDVTGALFATDVQCQGPSAVFAHLDAHRDRWDSCDFQQLRAGVPLLRTDVPEGWQERRTVQDVCPVLPLPDAAAGFSEVVPGRQLQKLRYYRGRAERASGLRAERANEETFPRLFEGLLRLHAARWQATGKPGVLADEAVRQFHCEAASGLLRAGVLRLYGLYVGDRLAACYYGFLAKERAWYYLGGFDPELEHLSPGMLAVGHAIEEAAREGAREFDFLRGAEPYKYRWGARDRLNYRRYVCHRPTPGREDAGE